MTLTKSLEVRASAPPSTAALGSFKDVGASARLGAPALVALSATTVAIAYHVALLVHVYQNAHFSGDDVITFCQIADKGFIQFVLTPLNEHFVPLHRLVAYLAHAGAPMSYGFALLVLTSFHVLGVVYLHGTLRVLERTLLPSEPARASSLLCTSPWSWVLLGLYAGHVYLSPLYGWWTAGLHRLPFIACALLGTYHYFRYRERDRPSDCLLCVLGLFAGLGFFVKAVLVPSYLLGLELCLWLATGRPPRKKHLLLLGACLAAFGALMLVWRAMQPAQMSELNLDPKVQRDFFAATAIILRDGAVGSIFSGGLFGLSVQAPSERVLASLMWGVLFVSTVFRRPSNLLVWGVLLLVLAPNVLLVSLSKHRTGEFGALAALLNQRYYFEMYFPVVLFLAVAGYRARWPKQGRAASSLTAAVAVLALSLVALNAWGSSRHFVNNAQAKRFIERLQADAARVAQRTGHPIRIVEGGVPAYIVAWPPEYAKASVVLPAMGIDVTLASAQDAAYQVLPTGELTAVTQTQ